MSSLKRMAIQGIRSFSPDDEALIEWATPLTVISGANGTGKSTIIESLKYATTGILPPGLGAKSGQAFIFDPDLAQTSEVKAQIRLVFRNRVGGQVLVVRSFKVTQKNQKKTFQALDGVIKLRDTKTGDITSQSQKCADLDRIVPELLGVSPAILDNVIFCHQEENNWPMRESTELKKKFDDIFESTRYTKALLELRKMKKVLAERSKDAKRDVDVSQRDLNQSNELKQELEDLKYTMDENTEKTNKLRNELQIIESDLQVALKELKNHQGAYDELYKLNSMIAERERTKALDAEEFDKNSRGKMPVDWTTMSLEEGDNFEREIKETQAKTQLESTKCWQAKVVLEKRKQELLKELNIVSEQRARYGAMLDESERQGKRHGELAQQARMKFIGHGPSKEINTPEQLRDQMDALVVEKKHQVDRAEKAARVKHDEKIAVLDKIRAENTSLCVQKKQKEQAKGDLLKQIDGLRIELEKLGEQSESESAMKSAKFRWDEAQKSLDRHRASKDLTEKNKLIEDWKKESSELDTQKSALEFRISTLESFQEIISKLKSKREDVAAKMRRAAGDFESKSYTCRAMLDIKGDPSGAMAAFNIVNDLLAPLKNAQGRGNSGFNSTQMTEIMESQMNLSTVQQAGDDDDGRVQMVLDALETLKDRTEKVVTSMKKSIEDHQRKLDTNQSELNVSFGKLALLEKEYNSTVSTVAILEGLLPKIGFYDVLQNKAPVPVPGESNEQTALRALEQELASKRNVFEDMKSVPKFQNRYLRHVKDGICPTCTRKISDDDATVEFSPTVDILYNVPKHRVMEDDLIVEFKKGEQLFGKRAVLARLAESVSGVKFVGEIEAAAAELHVLESRLIDFRKHIPTYLKLEQAKAREDEFSQALFELKQTTPKMQNVVERLKTELKGLDDSFLQMGKSDTAIRDVLRTVREASYLEEEIQRESAGVMSMSGAGDGGGSLSLDQVRAKLRSISQQKDRLSEHREEEMRAIQAHQTETQRLTQSTSDAQKSLATMEKNNLKRNELVKERKHLDEQLGRLIIDIRGLESLLQPVAADMERAEEDLALADSQTRKEMEAARQDSAVCVQMQQTLETVREAMNEATKSGAKQNFQRIEAEMLSKRQEIEGLEKQVVGLEREQGQHQVVMKNVDDMLRFGGLLMRLVKSRVELDQANAKKAELEHATQGDASSSRDLQDSVKLLNERKFKMSMEIQKLAGAREAHNNRASQIKSALMEPNLKDIDKKHADKALEYFTTSLAAKDLDKYCKALDTALMKFHSEKINNVNKRIRELWSVIYRGGDIERVEIKAEQCTAGNLQTYTYRVTMRKNFTDLDMRGRCSAGQKALACLVIRMALAETFSINCGILACDEPSENLDYENKQSLATALADLINMHVHKSNFQLILITHDEDFLEMLRSAGVTSAKSYRVARRLDAHNKYVSFITDISQQANGDGRGGGEDDEAAAAGAQGESRDAREGDAAGGGSKKRVKRE